MIEILILIVVCLCGSMVQAVTGFGYAILAMSILTFFIPFKTASVSVGLLALVMTCQITYKLRAHIRFKMLLVPLFASIIGRTLGVYLLVHVDPNLLKIALGILLVLLSLWFIFFSQFVKIGANLRNGLVAGFLSGSLGGVCNIGGPPLAVYYFSTIENKNEYNATIQATFALGGVYTILLNFLYGNITSEVLRLSATGGIAMILGTWAGIKIFNKINRNMLRKMIYSFVMVMGFLLLYSSFK